MDWTVLAGIVVAGWAMLSVITGERMSRSQALAFAAAEQAKLTAKAAAEVPIAVASDMLKAVAAAGPAKSAKATTGNK